MSQQRDDLFKSICQQFPSVMATHRFGDLVIQYCRPADPEQVLDQETLLTPHDELPWQPYWAQAWDAAIGVSHHLASLDLSGLAILDLGCGLGITSAVALARGARVVSGDNAPPALLYTRWNCWPWRDRSQVQWVDWRKTVMPERFDIVVGSDILYDRQEIDHLHRFWRAHLQSTGRILLGDPCRPMTREFLDQLAARSWRLRISEIQCAELKRPVRLVELSWPDAGETVAPT